MKILYITQFYPPETGAASVRAYEFSWRWSKAGHDITVLTGFPNYPKGELYSGFKNKIYKKEKSDKLTIIRVFTYIPKYKNTFSRIINQLIFSLLSIYGGAKASRPDVIIVTSPPFGIGIIGYILSRIWRSRLIFEVRDLFPQSAISFGVLKNPYLIWSLKIIEQFYYKKSDIVVGVTQGICDFIQNKGIPREKIRKITNGVNVELFRKFSSISFRTENKLEDHFIVMYTGIHGRAENLSVLIKAAELLKREKQIRFVLVGDGVEKENLIAMVNKSGLTNVIFIDTQPAEKIPYILASADICFSSRKNVDVNYGALPVKIFEYMACAKPVILAIKGEAEAIIRESHAGVCVDPDDAITLARMILTLSANKQRLEEYGKNGRDYVKRFYDRKKLANHYLELISEITCQATQDCKSLS